MWHRAIIDADSLIYRCGFAAEGEEVSHACHNLKSQIGKITDFLGVQETTIFIKGKGNFRDDVAWTLPYKGTRPVKVPTHYLPMREYLKNYHGAKEVDGMEADDAASIELWHNRDRDSGVILAAMDKDLWNTPGWHFNYDPRKWKYEYLTVQAADRNFIHQVLTGDRSDNVPGLPWLAKASRDRRGFGSRGARGIGPAVSKAALAGMDNKAALEEVWKLYREYFQELGTDERIARDYFVEQGRLLWMTRELHTDGSPVLWEPPAFLEGFGATQEL